MGENPYFKIPGTTQAFRIRCRDIQILRKYKFDTFYQNITASIGIVGGDGECLQSALMFFAVRIDFCEDHDRLL